MAHMCLAIAVALTLPSLTPCTERVAACQVQWTLAEMSPITLPPLPAETALIDPAWARDGYANVAQPYLAKTRYLLALNVDWTTGTINGQARVLFVNATPDTLTHIVFRLYPNHPATPASGTPLAHLRMKIQNLTVNDTSVAWATNDQYQSTLDVPLPTPLPPGGAARIDTNYTVTYPQPADELDGLETFPLLAVYDNGTNGLAGTWREDISTKGLDYIFSETALFAVTLRTSDHLALYSVGAITSTDADPATHRATYHITTGPVRDFVFVLTRNWGYFVAQGAPVPIDVHYKGDPVAAQEEGTIAAQAFAYYDSHYGPYPYARLTYLVLSFPSGGIQYPTLLLDDNARDTNYRRFIAAHEVAHEWFYGIAGNDPLRHAWLDESLAQISLYLFFRDVYNQDVADAEWTHILYWARQANSAHMIDTPVMQFNDFNDYMSHTYGTGAVFLRQLAEQIGYDQFVAGLSAYLKQVYLGVGTPEEFLAAMQAQTSIPLAPVFCQGIGYCPN
jgi:hypothetical protein